MDSKVFPGARGDAETHGFIRSSDEFRRVVSTESADAQNTRFYKVLWQIPSLGFQEKTLGFHQF